MTIHVECLPDETLIKKLGFSKKQVKHHQGKSRVFADIRNKSGQIALVDEDPGSAPHPYEKELVLEKEANGIKYFIDKKRENKIFVLKGKLEDWIIAACAKSKTNTLSYGLPQKPNDLHDVINNRIPAFEKLLDALLENKNLPISQLSQWLNAK